MTAAAVLVTLTACSAGADGSTGTAAGDEPVTLVVWESLEGRKDFIEQAGEAFQEEHPNVTVKYQNVELGDALGQIALDGPAGVGPDVFAGPSNTTGDLVTGGHILAVENPDALTSALVDGAVQSVMYDDIMYGVPVTVDTFALFYNKEFVTEPPTTWEDVKAFAAGFNDANPGKYGFVINPSAYYAAPFAFSAPDNLLFGPDGTDVDTPNTNSPATVAGMEEFAGLREILPVPAADLDAASVDSIFEGGEAALHITGSWNIPVFEDAGLDFGVTTLPAMPGSDEPSGAFVNSRTMYVSAYTEHPTEAQEFAAFLATPEMQELAFEVTGSVPSIDIPVESEATAGLIAQASHSFATPSIPPMTQFWTAMDAAVQNIWNGADVQTELDTATDVISGS
ncbi:maltose ABC transporter substrate-binding protein [Myceligenerans sp. I2]|uniref:Maltodextrin-binding protein n=2 Tax=Myceligenerans indicum TaxID=2593663 RepID=A0ABS1LP63_9MICO|nr:maltose ABC transporter substrate-binding protein [Myceligenerans indicum]